MRAGAQVLQHDHATGKTPPLSIPSEKSRNLDEETPMTNEAESARDGSVAAFPWLSSYPEGVPHEIGPLRYRLLGEVAGDLARRRPAARAFTTIMPNGMSGSLGFAEVDRYSDDFAAYLREVLALERGARVAVQLPNGLAYPVISFGILKAGCVLVNVNPLYTPRETADVLANAEVSALVGIDMFADKLAAVLADIRRPHVVLCDAAAFFARATRHLIHFSQKYVRKQIPKSRIDHVPLDRALAMGAAAIRNGADIGAYTRDLADSAIACLQYTGGTTGVSKGAMLSHRNLVVNAAQFLTFAGTHMSATDVVLTALPLYHIFAFTVNFLGFFIVGAHNVLIPSPRPLKNLERAFAKQKITFVTGVNTLFNGLANEAWFCAAPPRSLRVSVAGGMALKEVVARRWAEVTRTPITEGYGLSESSPVLTCNPFGRIKLGTIGVPLPSTEVKIVGDDGNEVAQGEPGELVARGPQVMAGYWKEPEETHIALRDGWLYTGDIATMDDEGYFKIVDRRKDMILVSGFNVYPNEVEACLATLDGVKECAVIGVADAATGEAVKAFVVRSDPTLSAAAIRAFCRGELASYKVPKHVEFRDDLPKTNVGKILRKDLRAEEARKHAG
jgi:long-chain acyl-CoA synthetase